MRYAIYHTPERDHALTKAAATWLGRDAFGGEFLHPDLSGKWTAKYHTELVRDAARYGFHATLKAPFSLAQSASESELRDAFETLKFAQEDIVIASLVLRQIDGFFALVPEQPNEMLNEFAGVLVREFDRFRAPLTTEDIARRNPENLSVRQRDQLEHWGYPYVFDDFFFHMTLTGRVAANEAENVQGMLEQQFAAFIGKPYVVSHFALFVEPAPGSNFSVRAIRPVNSAHALEKA